MAISCASCGAAMPEVSEFCPACGRTVSHEAGVAEAPPPGLKTRLAGAAAYVTVIPAAFFLVMAPYKREPFVRFHAFQSIVLAVAGMLIAGSLRLMWIPLSMLPMGLLIAALTTMIVTLGWVIL